MLANQELSVDPSSHVVHDKVEQLDNPPEDEVGLNTHHKFVQSAPSSSVRPPTVQNAWMVEVRALY